MEGTTAEAEDLVAVYKAAWRSEGFISRAHEEKRFRKESRRYGPSSFGRRVPG